MNLLKFDWMIQDSIHAARYIFGSLSMLNKRSGIQGKIITVFLEKWI